MARELSVPLEAVELYRRSDVFDLHVDSFIWTRILRYDLTRRHRWSPLGRRYLGQVDMPRALDAGLTGAMWSITTNPARTAAGRQRAFLENLVRLKDTIATADAVRHVRNVAEYREARAAAEHGAFIAIQGGNPVKGFEELDPAVGRDVVRVTLVHLTTSCLGETSSPLGRLARTRGLTDTGREFVRDCNGHRILVDLAHASPGCFWQAVEVHDPALPFAVTHTGVSGVHPSWRNLDDDQLRAVAASGGCVGVMLHESFLADGSATVGSVADHLEHIADVAGEDTPAIGTDLDGMVVPPKDLSGYPQLPRLVHELMSRSWSADRIQKVLGGNALRTIEDLRG